MVDWPALTRSRTKRELYARETYFREGLADAEEVADGQLSTVLHEGALLVVKPDGLASGQLLPVLDYLGEHGFTVAGARDLLFQPFHWRELWRYQLTSATLDRLAVNELVLGAGPALLLLLRGEPGHLLPGAVRLSTLKGSATLEMQKPGTLRALLGQPNRILSYVHVADEPADLLRELGLLLDPAARRALLGSLVNGAPAAEDEDTLRRARERFAAPVRSLDRADALERVTRAVDEAGPGPAADAARYRLERMARDERVAWRPFLAELDAAGARPDRWDLAVLGTYVIEYDEPGFAKVLTNPDARSWESVPRPDTSIGDRHRENV
ncbi:nucleoside-diphosphate kinase [Streptomyces sp. CRN 30]|uniref:nucleoside-diphosphate kinase n=1 Tax=Streptomyces sp. CRN 30 TaxID=3075613 RepID=UPI002A835E99|nr:nucleoside-diphosphate kinase [Streptomyces sp. CRN 30]